MARLYSDIRKFKQLEAAFRETANRLGQVVAQIEKAQKRKLPDADRSALDTAYARWSDLHRQSKEALAAFWDDVDAGGSPPL